MWAVAGLGTCVLDSPRLSPSLPTLARAHVSLRDALGPLALYAAEDSPKYGKAATRWLGRLALESDDPSLHDVQLPRPRFMHCLVAPIRCCWFSET